MLKSDHAQDLPTSYLLSNFQMDSRDKNFLLVLGILGKRGDLKKANVLAKILDSLSSYSSLGDNSQVRRSVLMFAGNQNILRISNREGDSVVCSALCIAFLRVGLWDQARRSFGKFGDRVKASRVYGEIIRADVPIGIVSDIAFSLAEGRNLNRHSELCYLAKLFRNCRNVSGLDRIAAASGAVRDNVKRKIDVALAQGYIRALKWEKAKRHLRMMENSKKAADVVLRECRMKTFPGDQLSVVLGLVDLGTNNALEGSVENSVKNAYLAVSVGLRDSLARNMDVEQALNSLKSL